MDASFGKQYLLIALCAVNRVKQSISGTRFRGGISVRPLESCWLVILAR